MWPFRKRNRASSTTMDVLGFVSPGEVGLIGGLPREAVVGSFAGEGRRPESFRPNPAFIDFMHEIIRTAGPSDPSLRAAAREQGDGWLYLIDLRTPEGATGNVPAQDIVGAFQVQSGEIVPDSYQRFPEHRVYTAHGVVRLPPFLRESLVTELRKRNVRP